MTGLLLNMVSSIMLEFLVLSLMTIDAEKLLQENLEEERDFVE